MEKKKDKDKEKKKKKKDEVEDSPSVVRTRIFHLPVTNMLIQLDIHLYMCDQQTYLNPDMLTI